MNVFPAFMCVYHAWALGSLKLELQSILRCHVGRRELNLGPLAASAPNSSSANMFFFAIYLVLRYSRSSFGALTVSRKSSWTSLSANEGVTRFLEEQNGQWGVWKASWRKIITWICTHKTRLVGLSGRKLVGHKGIWQEEGDTGEKAETYRGQLWANSVSGLLPWLKSVSKRSSPKASLRNSAWWRLSFCLPCLPSVGDLIQSFKKKRSYHEKSKRWSCHQNLWNLRLNSASVKWCGLPACLPAQEFSHLSHFLQITVITFLFKINNFRPPSISGRWERERERL